MTVALVRVFGLIVDAVLPLPITTGATVVLEADDEAEPDPDAELDVEPATAAAAELLPVVLDPEGDAELPELDAGEVCAEEDSSVVDETMEVGVLEGDALVCVDA